jgi:molybdopterin/thiamine biosynthesis adenylyltransferase
MLKPWWVRVPERLDFEFEALRRANIKFERSPSDFARDILVLDLVVPLENNGQVELVAAFPDLYPYVRPEVYAPSLSLAHHQNPFGKNLCLLGRRSDAWLPEMTLADLVGEQLGKVLDANKAENQAQAAHLEEHQGEPLSAFYSYVQNGVVLVGDNFSPPLFDLAADVRFARLKGNDGVLTVVSLRSTNGDVVWQIDPQLASSFTNETTGRWVRLEKPIRLEGGAPFDDELIRRHPELGKRGYVNDLDHILIGFPDELRWFEQQLNWVMLMRKKNRRGVTIRPDERMLLRVQRVGVGDRAARVPQAAMLATKRVAVFGVGCLGAPLALHFARCGVANLFLIDWDTTDAATTVRWPLGIPAAGRLKVEALTDFIKLNYPWTKVTPLHDRIGFPNPAPPLRRDAEVLDEVFSNVDIVIDATAEFGLQRMLSDLALETNVPYVGLFATLGGIGGQVLRLVRGRTGCWRCVRLYEEAGVITAPPTLPDDSLVQPLGCGAATYIGGSFDLEEVSLMAVRVALRTLDGNAVEDFQWDVATMSLRGADGESIPPIWATARTPPHAGCPQCPAA